MNVHHGQDGIMRNGHNVRTIVFGLLLFAAALLAGCTSIGPKTIPRDRFDYAAAAAWPR